MSHDENSVRVCEFGKDNSTKIERLELNCETKLNTISLLLVPVLTSTGKT